jgi:TonB family protein
MIPYVMLYAVAAGIPILLGAVAVAAILRRYGRPERAVWMCALVLAFVIPAISLLDPVRSAPAVGPLPGPGIVGLPEVVAIPVPTSTLDLGRVLVALWVAVSLSMATHWMIATLRLSWSTRSWRPGSIDGVQVLMTADVGPAVSGVLRPRVLAPEWLTTLPSTERELILLHEQEHVRARDPLLVAVARAARILTPWNPVVWALTRKLVRAVELDCDRRVLKRSADVAAYGRTLLKVSARRPGRMLAAAAFAESEAPLRGRILAMTTPSRAVSIAAIAAATVLGVVLLVGALGIPVPTMSLDVQLAAATPDQTPSVTVFDAPPTPPPPPPPAIELPSRPVGPQPTIELQQLVVRRSATGQVIGYGYEPVDDAAANARRLETIASRMRAAVETPANVQVPEPAFTPMTVRPTLTNANDVSQALMREYPAMLRDAGIGGAPVMWIYIDENGLVADTRVHETSGYEALDQAAMNVARVMTFTPARNGDDVVATWVQIPIRFAVVNN